jgi:tetratricopeptide (TPR) repeat protein
LAILRAFFVDGWKSVQPELPNYIRTELFNLANITLCDTGFKNEALKCAMAYYLHICESSSSRSTALSNLAWVLFDLKRFALAHRIWKNCLRLAEVESNDESLFLAHVALMVTEGDLGNLDAADTHWRELDPLERDWDIKRYRVGGAEYRRLHYLFNHAEIDAEALSWAEELARSSLSSRRIQRSLMRLRGMWHLKREEFDLAAACLERASAMARESGQRDAEAETALVRAKLRHVKLSNSIDEAIRLESETERTELGLALLWEELGDREKALLHAHKACEEASADGESWAIRSDLTAAKAIIDRLGGLVYKCKVSGPRFTWPENIEQFPSPSAFFATWKTWLPILAR